MTDPSDFFDFGKRLIDQITDLQALAVEQLFATEAFEPPQTVENAIDTTVEVNRNLFNAVSANPAATVNHHCKFIARQLQLATAMTQRAMGNEVPAVAVPAADDLRFTDPAWDEEWLFSYLKQFYLITAESLTEFVDDLEGVDEHAHKRLRFYMRQFVNAFAPTNFPSTNPEIIRKTVETKGTNLVDGLALLAEDRRRSSEIVSICMSRRDGFELGRDIACTPGKVVMENAVMQLIQYEPATATVHSTPVLLVPSWVNKYYVMDLSPRKSLIRWLVAQGHTVFVISWVNPGVELCGASFSDYLLQGPVAAIEEIGQITGEPRVSLMGYCLGGILTASVAAWYGAAADDRLASVTYLAASLEYSNPGGLGNFIDAQLVESVSRHMERKGYLDGRLLAAGFSLLRENDLFWHYYVKNYLKGERPMPFDVMHWNGDNTNVPAALHRFVMSDLHLADAFVNPAGLTVAGRPIALANATAPTYVLATEGDHIASWQSCYCAVTLQQRAAVRFVLAGSGHIAGVINPPEANKYHYYTGESRFDDAQQWRASASRHEGSWWTDWHAWQLTYAGAERPARTVESRRVIEVAPGRYVRRRLDVPAVAPLKAAV